MSKLKTSTGEILVHLVRPGAGSRDYHLMVGATLADLRRLSGSSMANQAVLVDGVVPEEALTLHQGAVVTLVTPRENAAGDEPWRATIPAFQDEALFQEYLDAIKDRRRELNPNEEADQG